MRKLNLFALLGFLCYALPVFATGDSLSYLLPSDSVHLVRDQWNEKYIVHVMAPGQTLYGLSEHYGLELEDLFQYNANLTSENFTPGTEVRIPVPNFAIMRYATEGLDLYEAAPLFYIVRPGDTMYGLTKRLFHMPESIIMARNHMNDKVLSVGQKIFIGWIKTSGIEKHQRNYIGKTPQERQSYQFGQRYRRELGDGTERVEKGKARWTAGEKNQLYVLHRRAKKGSIVRIHSTLNNKTFYARVIGSIPDERYNNDVKVILSEALARCLGAVDSRLFVEIGYLR